MAGTLFLSPTLLDRKNRRQFLLYQLTDLMLMASWMSRISQTFIWLFSEQNSFVIVEPGSE